MTDDELRAAVALARGRADYVSLEVEAVVRLLARVEPQPSRRDAPRCQCGGPVWRARGICVDCGAQV